MYKIVEIFTSIQGEGRWSGYPATFIRFGDCNLQCSFCDTSHGEYSEMNLSQILNSIPSLPKRIVITGGEPTLYDLSLLIKVLKSMDYKIHVETNGMVFKSWLKKVDWITLSPKNKNIHLTVLILSNEIKWLIGKNTNVYTHYFLSRRDTIKRIFNELDTIHYFQPVDEPGIEENIKKCIELTTKYPNTAISFQIHKKYNLR